MMGWPGRRVRPQTGHSQERIHPEFGRKQEEGIPTGTYERLLPTLIVRSISVRNCSTSASHRQSNREAGRAPLRQLPRPRTESMA